MKRLNKQKEREKGQMEMALASINVAIEHIDLMGRNAPFRWPTGADVIRFEEHKEIMKTLLYWQRELTMYKELRLEEDDAGETGVSKPTVS